MLGLVEELCKLLNDHKDTEHSELVSNYHHCALCYIYTA